VQVSHHAAQSATTTTWSGSENARAIASRSRIVRTAIAASGDIDVENFPTLAIYRDRKPLHFGVSLPHETTVGRLVDALADSGQPLADAPDEVAALPASFERP